MLRYKRWTFEAWYQSECTIIPSLAPWLAFYHLETYFEKIPLVKNSLEKESYIVISSHHLILQLSYTTQAWILKFKTCAMQAKHMKCTFKCTIQVHELAPPTCVLKILIYPFPFSLLSPYVIYQVYLYVSSLFYYFYYYLCFSLLCHQWPQRF